ncbi:MAG: putative oxidoreductase [Planctomycetaceae bacterium]|nr:putative oxidoreductase [Planctomycetaceae bacterium]
MSAYNDFGIAVVGTGFIGPVHVEALRRAGQHVVGIVGSTPEKSRQAAASLGLETGYADLDEVLSDRRIGAVHLTTPNHLHFEQATRVLRAGKHVLCEKPLAMNSHETAQLVSLALETGVVAGVAYNIRFYPLCHEAAARIRDRTVGQVLHVTGSYVQDWLLKQTDFNWRVQASEGGELRAVADIGTHWLDLLQFITGDRIVAVCADLHTVHATRLAPTGGVETFSGKSRPPVSTRQIPVTTEDCGSVMLRFQNGARGSLWVSQVTAGRKNCLRFEIAGSDQALAWNSEQPNELWIGHRDQANELLIRDPALMSQSARFICSYPGGHNEGFSDTFKQLFRAFYGYISAGDFSLPVPFPTFSDGHQEVVLCEAILRSHRERRWIEFG